MPRHSTKAVPIIDPDTGQQKASGSDWPALPKSLPAPTTATSTTDRPVVPTHTSKKNKKTSKSTNGVQGGQQAPRQIDVARRAAREGIENLNLTTKLTANTNNALAQQTNAEISFNIYARPFIPRSFTIINSLPGRTVSTFARKGVNYDMYNRASFGPAAGFLPVPPPIGPTTAIGPSTDTLGPRRYEAYFQHHLRQETEAERKETEACSLYGHEVVLEPASPALFPGETICTLQVPGLRENSPFVEEEDIVQLRQLRYGEGNQLLGMSEWLKMRDDSQSVQSQPQSHQVEAPGWTNIVYLARVMVVKRATETLWLRVLGLPPPATKRIERFNIQFQVSLERNMPLHYALPVVQHILPQGGWMNSMLFPTNSDCDIQEKLHPGVFHQRFFDQTLNWEQKKAVESIWLRQYGTLPYLISGPPGTGKTLTLIEVVLQFIKNSMTLHHILVCAPSDPAADTLCLRLKGYLPPVDMLRLNRPCRTFAEVPDSLLPYCCIQGEEFGLPPLGILMRYRVVVTSCRDASMLTRARVTNKDLFAVQGSCQRVTMAISPYETLPEVKLHWTALLLDEAAQATEPEALIPLTVVAPPAEHYPSIPTPLVVMAGDEHQLGPRTSLPGSPLRESLFGRLFKRSIYAEHTLARGKKGEAPVPLTQAVLPLLRPAFTNLIRNYRSHPAILAIPSKLFYWDTLEPEARDVDRLANWKGWQGQRWPVLFHDNPSLDDLELPGLMKGTGGWFNNGEAAVACDYARSLVQSGLLTQDEVCIMSPFKAQVRVLRNLARKPEYGSMWDVNIGPTEAFQGLEKGVVILCVTRARKKFVVEDQKLGWGIIGMPNKMNVALTRAKYGLIVVGSRDLLKEDSNWREFLEFCDRNGLIAQSESLERRSRDGVAPLDESKLTRQEKVMIERERLKNMSTGPVWGVLRRI
ncbi:hypothetical protein N0V82_010533 [Gnomoniopsis sp. IMI 355080]|nr:hypothetical protein N0V82_010533 [Gnomoniopsis sp. IMI 355080]